MTRRKLLGILTIWISGLWLSACGDETPAGGGDTGGNCVSNGTTVAIAGNHGHALTVSVTDIQAAADKTYDITGTGGHAHSVTITAAQFQQLAANTSLSLTSTSSGHTHVVTVGCA